MGSFSGILCVCILANAVFNTSGTQMTVVTSETAFTPYLTTTLSLGCDVTPRAASAGLVGRSLRKRQNVYQIPDDIQFVTSLVVLRDGVDVASVSEHIAARALLDVENLRVNGSISGSEGYISLEWSYPNATQGGSYTCTVSGLDDVGHGITHSSSTVIDLTTATINELAEKTHDLDIKDEDLEAKMEAKFKMLEQDNEQMKNNIRQINQENTQMKIDLLQIIHNQDEKMMGLINETRHVESGILNCVVPTGGNKDQHITFSKPYETVPMVNVGIVDGSWYVSSSHSDFHVNVLQVDQTGFTVRCNCDGSYHTDRLRVSWTSFSQD